MAHPRILPLFSALAVALTLAGCAGPTPEERLERIKEAMQQRDPMAAELEARKIIDKHPDDPAALTARQALVGIFMQDRRQDEALVELEALMAKTPLDDSKGLGIQMLSMYNNILKGQKRYADALKLVEAKEKEFSKNSIVMMNLKVARVDIYSETTRTAEARKLIAELRTETTATMALRQFRQMELRSYGIDRDTTGAKAFLETELAKAGPGLNGEGRREILSELLGIAASEGDYAETRRRLTELTTLFDDAMRDELDPNMKAQMAYGLADLHVKVGSLATAREVLAALNALAMSDKGFGGAVAEQLAQVTAREGKSSEAVAILREVSARLNDERMMQNVARLSDALATGKLTDNVDTSPLTVKFRADAPLAVKNLPSTATTGTAPAKPAPAAKDAATTPAA